MKTVLIVLMWIAIVVGIIVGIDFLFHDRYQMTGVYCNYYGTGCVYRQRGINQSTCPEWWDNSGVFDRVNNLRLKLGTCKVTYEGDF